MLLFVLTFGLSTTSFALEQLNVLGWCDHSDPSLLKPFENQYGVRVNVKEYDGTGIAEAIIKQSRPGDWDVFVVDSVDVNRMVKRNILQPLDPSDYPMHNYFKEVISDDLNKVDGRWYAITEKFGYNAVAFNNKKASVEEMRKIQTAWDPKYKGRVAVYDYYIPTIELAAIALGMKPSEISEDDLPAIKAKLIALKKNSMLFGDVVQTATALVTGDADIIFSGGEFSVSAMRRTYRNLDWVIPDEGALRWQMSIAIFKNSKKQDLAKKFLQYITGPEGQGKLATSSCFWAMPANKKANLGLRQKKILRWSEQPTFLKNSYMYYIPDENLNRAMLQMWEEVLSY